MLSFLGEREEEERVAAARLRGGGTLLPGAGEMGREEREGRVGGVLEKGGGLIKEKKIRKKKINK